MSFHTAADQESWAGRLRPWPGRALPLLVLALLAWPGGAQAASVTAGPVLSGVAIGIVVAALLAYLATLTRQPFLLAYLAAGALIGPRIGFGFIRDPADVQSISELGLVLLLFIIGVEIDLKKLRGSGLALVSTGIAQFILCVALGLGFFFMLGFRNGGGNWDLLYLSVCCAISSTTLVVKLLYDKQELETLAGRITVGVLVFQNIWVMLFFRMQPNLGASAVLVAVYAVLKGTLLVAVALGLSRTVLKSAFRRIAKLPELVLVTSLAWCFFIAGLANALNLSMEVGALIAGAAIASFPYNLDVTSKIVSIRDFFLTLFFVGLGMQIPNPLEHPGLLVAASLAAGFVIVSRFLAVFPVLYGLRSGLRISTLVPINLAQVSELGLVIASLGVEKGHIGPDILDTIVLTFTITAVTSTYMIQYSHPLQAALTRGLKRLGVPDIASQVEPQEAAPAKEIALLGFFQVASSLVEELGKNGEELRDQLVVVDFNPEVHRKLNAIGVKVIYGDISAVDTLQRAGIGRAKVVVSSIPDSLLKGTDNLKLIQQMQKICPEAKIIATAESPARALQMYAAGADYVLLPRIHAARQLIPVIKGLREGGLEHLKEQELEALRARAEVIG